MLVKKSEQNTQESNEESGILAHQELTQVNPNRFVYPVILWVGYGAVGMEFLFTKFMFTHSRNALRFFGETMGLTPELASQISLFPAIAIAGLDLITNVTLFDAHTEAMRWQGYLPQGFLWGSYNYLKKMFDSLDSFFTCAIPTIAMTVTFLIAGYANVEPYQSFITTHLGLWSVIPLGVGMALSASFFFLSMSMDCMYGVQFLLNREQALLCPPLQSIAYHFYNGDCATKTTTFQIGLEGLAGIINRSVLYTFLAYQLLTQANCQNPVIILSAEITTAILSFIAIGLIRWPSAYKEYFGTQNARLDLILASERADIYEKNYANMSWGHFFLREIVRFAKSPLGIAESMLSGYFASYLPILLYKIEFFARLIANSLLPAWVFQYAFPTLSGVLFAAFSYYFYRKADLMKELNKLALQEESVRLRINGLCNPEADVRAQDLSIANATNPASNIANTIAAVSTFGKSIGIVLNGHSFWMGVLKDKTPLSSKDLTALSIGTNTIVASNAYVYVKPKVEQTIETFAKRASQSLDNLLSKARDCFFTKTFVAEEKLNLDRDIEDITTSKQSMIPCTIL